MKNTERRWRKMGYFNQQPAYSVQDDTFTLWQLPSQINTIGNSCVIQTDDGKVIVIDGGIGAFTRILQNPKGMLVWQICYSKFSDALMDREPDYKNEELKNNPYNNSGRVTKVWKLKHATL